MPRWIDIISTNTTIHHSTNTATPEIHAYRISVQQSQCSALVMQSEANHAVLTTFHWVCLQCSLQHTHTTSEIASIACLHDFSGPALLSCSKILTYQLLGSQMWTALPLEKSRSPATVNKVSKSRHNSRKKL